MLIMNLASSNSSICQLLQDVEAKIVVAYANLVHFQKGLCNMHFGQLWAQSSWGEFQLQAAQT